MSGHHVLGRGAPGLRSVPQADLDLEPASQVPRTTPEGWKERSSRPSGWGAGGVEDTGSKESEAHLARATAGLHLRTPS